MTKKGSRKYPGNPRESNIFVTFPHLFPRECSGRSLGSFWSPFGSIVIALGILLVQFWSPVTRFLFPYRVAYRVLTLRWPPQSHVTAACCHMPPRRTKQHEDKSQGICKKTKPLCPEPLNGSLDAPRRCNRCPSDSESSCKAP